MSLNPCFAQYSLPTAFPFIGIIDFGQQYIRQDVHAETRQGGKFFIALVKELKRTRVDDDVDLE